MFFLHPEGYGGEKRKYGERHIDEREILKQLRTSRSILNQNQGPEK